MLIGERVVQFRRSAAWSTPAMEPLRAGALRFKNSDGKAPETHGVISPYVSNYNLIPLL